jgi:hypothetical protein
MGQSSHCGGQSVEKNVTYVDQTDAWLREAASAPEPVTGSEKR